MSQAPAIVLALPCLHAGGTEYQTRSLADALLRDGWRVSLLVYFDEVSTDMLGAFRAAGVDVRLLALPRSTPLPFLLRRLAGAFRATQADLIHVQYMAPGFVPVVAARLARVPRVFATVHQPATPYGRKARFLLRTAASMCDVFLCNSLATEESWFGSSRMYEPGTHRHPRGHYTLYNSVDVQAIAVRAHATSRSGVLGGLGFSRSPVIGVVGRLRSEKGQETAIRALPSLLKTHPSAGLLVVGDGPDRGRLEALCRTLGVGNAVCFAGAVSSEQIYSYYGAVDAVAVPSVYEGFCLVAAEAMAARVPIVASGVAALAEVLADGEAGVLTRPGDCEALASGLHRVLSDGELRARITQAAFARVDRLFSKTVFDRSAASIHCSRHDADEG